MSVTTVRQKVLAQLTKLGSASPRDLARALRLSEAGARHHLRVLAADGQAVVVQNRTGGRGRPVKVYALAPALVGDNLAGLAEALLAAAGPALDVEELASRILDAAPFSNLPIPKRLAVLVEKLNFRHYQARWEAGAEGPRVIFGRCPYAAVIEGHPELCRMDASLLGNALGRTVSQAGKIEKGQGACVFAAR